MGAILRAGVVVSALVALLGGALYLAERGGGAVDYHTFRGEPLSLRRPASIATEAAALHPRAIMQLAIVLLLATPLLRVLLSALLFAVQRDALYVVVTLMVLAILLFGLIGPHLP